MEDSPDKRGPNQWFYWWIAMKPLGLLKDLGLETLFPLGPTSYQWLVGPNSLKYAMKKNLCDAFNRTSKQNE